MEPIDILYYGLSSIVFVGFILASEIVMHSDEE